MTRKDKLLALLADDPNDAFARYGLAMEHVSAGDDEQAVAEFRELVQRNPDYVAGHQQLGQALQRLDRAAEARAAWQAGIAQAQRQGNAHAAQEMQGFLALLD